MHVCKRKPHACLSKRPAVDTFVSTQSQFRQTAGDIAARCKRSYMLRCLIPSIIPGDQKRAEAVVAVLVRFDTCADPCHSVAQALNDLWCRKPILALQRNFHQCMKTFCKHTKTWCDLQLSRKAGQYFCACKQYIFRHVYAAEV